MKPNRTQRIIWGHYDTDAAPSITGAGSITTEDSGWRIVDDYHSEICVVSDRTNSKPRTNDTIELQFAFTGVAQSADGTNGFSLTDGYRTVGVAIGASLSFVNPYISTEVIAVLDSSFAWNARNVFHLLKRSSERWELRVNGQVVGSIPYLLSEPSTGNVAGYTFGMIAAAPATATGDWEFYEVGVNAPLPPESSVQRFGYDLPAYMRDNQNSLSRMLIRRIISTLETPLRQAELAQTMQTAGGIPFEQAAFTGEVLPTIEVPVWTLSDAANTSVVRQRVRFDTAAASTTPNAAYTWVDPDIGAPTDTEVRARADIVLRGSAPTAGVDGETGLYLILDDGVKFVPVGLFEIPGSAAGTAWGWSIGWPGSLVSGYYWRVDPFQEHSVEVRLIANALVLLIVDGRIVDRLPYASLDATNPAYAGKVTIGAITATNVIVDTSNVRAERRLSDLQRRNTMLQTAVERLVFPGGAERNDELRGWLDFRFGVHAMRGTYQGILTELKRICNTERVYLVTDSRAAGWILDETFPDVTPIWLDLSGYLKTIYVEFAWQCPNFTLDALGRLVARYFLPISLLERTYHACLITAATAQITAGVLATAAVESSKGFAIGDTVTIRDFANAASEDCEITDIPTTTSIEFAVVANTWVYAPTTPPIVRKSLRTSAVTPN